MNVETSPVEWEQLESRLKVAFEFKMLKILPRRCFAGKTRSKQTKLASIISSQLSVVQLVGQFVHFKAPKTAVEEERERCLDIDPNLNHESRQQHKKIFPYSSYAQISGSSSPM
jgi:hypothetical protein